MVQHISLHFDSQVIEFETEIEWHETHKLLKCQFPVLVNADHATFETAYGAVQRPTHRNTSWDQVQSKE